MGRSYWDIFGVEGLEHADLFGVFEEIIFASSIAVRSEDAEEVKVARIRHT